MNSTNAMHNRKILIMLMVLAVIEAFVTIMRCFYGVETTDEAYYIANANMILQGQVPLSTIWTLHSGSLVAYAWLVGLYKIIVPNLEGVFLFTRIAFTAFKFVILIYGFCTLREVISVIPAFCACMLLVPYYSYIGNFSYNSIAVWGMILTGFIVCNTIFTSSRQTLKWGVVGGTMFLTAYSHLAMVFNVVLMAVICILFSEKKVKSVISYSLGGLISASAVLVWILIQGGGAGNLYYSLSRMFTSDPQNKRPGKWDTIYHAWMNVQYEVRSYVIVFAVSFSIAYLICKIKKIVSFKQIVCKSLIIGVCVWIGCDLLRIIYCHAWNENSCYGVLAGLASILIFAIGKKDKLNIVIFLTLCCPGIIFAFAAGLLTSAGVYALFWGMIPSIIGFVCILSHSMQELNFKNYVVYGACILSFLVGSMFFIICDYTYVYRDESITMLKHKVGNGIYKGLYTTENNANNLPEIENVIRKKTAECKTILAMDCAPEVYLMTNAETLAPNTWDNMHFHDGKNNPSIMYEYFEFMKEIPDVIVYVSSPNKKGLSIFSEDYLFNDFVKEYYVQDYHQTFGDDYEVVIFFHTGKGGYR